MARQAAAQHASAATAQRRAQAELLSAYRAQQQAREALERDALAAKLQAQWGLGGSEAWEAHGEAAWQQHDAWCGGSSALQSRAWLRALQQHESRWAALAAATSSAKGGGSSETVGCSSEGACISFSQVPWPPLGCEEYLLALAAWEEQQQQQQHAPQQQHAALQQQAPQQAPQQQQQQHAARQASQPSRDSTPAAAAAQRAQRRAYARACLRWHPDKFVARWGPLLDPADRVRILERVQALSQGLNEAWEALQRRAVGGDGEG